MVDPIFWLGVSILLVAVSLAAVLVAALPALQELARAARSAEKLFDTLSRELPSTLDSIRLASIEITNLTDDVNQNVQAAGRVVEQFDQSLTGVKQQAKQAQITTRSVMTGVKAAWQTWRRPTQEPQDFRDHSHINSASLDLATAANLASNLESASENLLEEAEIPYSQRLAADNRNYSSANAYRYSKERRPLE